MGFDTSAIGVAQRTAEVNPRDHEAAVSQPGDGGVVLITRGFRIDQNLATDLRAAGIKNLRLDSCSSDIPQCAVEIEPCNDEATVAQACDRRIVLVICGFGVDQKLAAHLCTGGIEHLRLDAATIGVAQCAAGVAPGDHEAAVAQSANRGTVLIARGFGVDQKLAAHLRTDGIEHLRLDAAAIGVAQRAAGVGPCDHEAAVAKTGNGGVSLVVCGLRVNQDFRPYEA